MDHFNAQVSFKSLPRGPTGALAPRHMEQDHPQ
jgi:hypothetical protein